MTEVAFALGVLAAMLGLMAYHGAFAPTPTAIGEHCGCAAEACSTQCTNCCEGANPALAPPLCCPPAPPGPPTLHRCEDE